MWRSPLASTVLASRASEAQEGQLFRLHDEMLSASPRDLGKSSRSPFVNFGSDRPLRCGTRRVHTRGGGFRRRRALCRRPPKLNGGSLVNSSTKCLEPHQAIGGEARAATLSLRRTWHSRRYPWRNLLALTGRVSCVSDTQWDQLFQQLNEMLAFSFREPSNVAANHLELTSCLARPANVTHGRYAPAAASLSLDGPCCAGFRCSRRPPFSAA